MATAATSNPSLSRQIAQWNRAYIALLLLRAYFALRPGYIYPDEYDRGKELIAGEHVVILSERDQCSCVKP